MDISKEEQTRLFKKKIFGFRVGQSVKKWEKGYWRTKGYWRYGKIVAITEDEFRPYRVKWSGDYYTNREKEENLVPCRKYRKRRR